MGSSGRNAENGRSTSNRIRRTDDGGTVEHRTAIRTNGNGSGVVDFASAARATLLQLQRRWGMDVWAVASRDGDDHVILSALDTAGLGVRSGDVLDWEDTFCAASLNGSAPRFSADADAEPGWARARRATGLPFRSYLSVPLTSGEGVVLGTLCAGSFDRVLIGLVDDLAEVEVAAGLLATVLSHELRLEEQQRRAEHAEATAGSDALTGLGNRRAWDAALASEEARARRLGSTASVLVLDVDGLKELNDTQGHAVGDVLLVRTADVLRGHLRPEDFCARTGGDEFAVLLPGAHADGAAGVSQRLRETLLETGVSASVGTATRRAATGLQAAWRQADAAMYVDKTARAGRRSAGAPGVLARASGGAVRAGAGAGGGEGSPTGRVVHLLDVARRQLGLDAVVVARFDGRAWRVQHAATAPGAPFPPIVVGERCAPGLQRVLARNLPTATRGVPAQRSTRTTPVTDVTAGALAAPIHRGDGSVHGVLCWLSPRGRGRSEPGDTGVLTLLAEAVGQVVSRDDERACDRRAVLVSLEELRRGGGPQPVYQPIVELTTSVVVGSEALSRFPTGSPDAWFADATRVGAGEDLELAAVTAALRQRPRTPGFLSLNVSPAVARSPAFSRLVGGEPLGGLVLEITEHERVEDYGALLRQLAPLRAAGLRVAVDDAGAGFASMHHVLALQPEFIKLDISLIRDVHRDPTRRALAGALTLFAGQTGAQVVAEGIETRDELECLRDLGVSLGQGYHLGRPAPSTVVV